MAITGGVLSGCGTQPASKSAPVESGASATDASAPVDLEVAIKSIQVDVSILPGKPTRVWTYQAQVLKGDPASVQALPDNYLGPIIRTRKGQRVRVQYTNELPGTAEQSIIHWHGLHLPEPMDGHPRYAIAPGKTYTYEFQVTNRAGTYWFHPHPHGRTAGQVYMGLAGLFIVSDEEESAAGLPSGNYDVPLILQDRSFGKDNQLAYIANPMGAGMMQTMMGFLGDRILVNGKPDFTLPVATRAYRLRLLNGSNSRIYKLAWDDGTPLTVIGTDGGLIEKPVQRIYVTLAPGERIELWADFSGRKVGDELTLRSLGFSGAEGVGASGGMGAGASTGQVITGTMDMGGMGNNDSGMNMGGMSMGNAQGQPLALGASFPVMKVRVERREQETLKLPAQLSRLGGYRVEDAANRNSPRSFGLTMRNMVWKINDRTFEMEGVTDGETVKLDTTEVWEFANQTNPGEMTDPMGMAHPFHIHGLQFQVIDRQALPALTAGWNTVREGYVDEGWKDTFLLMPGERVRLLLRFKDHTGLFVYHCHNLEHESAGMMRNYRVTA
ncbi:MAG: multicopper oxidase family protein [Chloroflexi bacterium]|nr:multicopper oxidase family protein [Chloroflexota bacterium]MCL5273263.1 multicopper oxidase family protein [Chloroflexota bacterium]